MVPEKNGLKAQERRDILWEEDMVSSERLVVIMSLDFEGRVLDS
jgi:hypothetical protein